LDASHDNRKHYHVHLHRHLGAAQKRSVITHSGALAYNYHGWWTKAKRTTTTTTSNKNKEKKTHRKKTKTKKRKYMYSCATKTKKTKTKKRKQQQKQSSTLIKDPGCVVWFAPVNACWGKKLQNLGWWWRNLCYLHDHGKTHMHDQTY